MEKPVRSKGNNIFKFLPNPTSFSIRNPPYSPGREKRFENLKKLKTHNNKAFSGPLIPMIPAEARRKPENGSFETQEPTSPKVSCMGQIKHKKKKITGCKRPTPIQQERKPPSFVIRKMFQRKVRPGRRSDADDDMGRPPVPVRGPSLGQMNRFTSGRETLANFDWRAQTRLGADDEESDEDEDEVRVRHSAPIFVVGGVAVEPKKEVNLWKRRTMAPPTSLQLK